MVLSQFHQSQIPIRCCRIPISDLVGIDVKKHLGTSHQVVTSTTESELFAYVEWEELRPFLLPAYQNLQLLNRVNVQRAHGRVEEVVMRVHSRPPCSFFAVSFLTVNDAFERTEMQKERNSPSCREEALGSLLLVLMSVIALIELNN